MNISEQTPDLLSSEEKQERWRLFFDGSLSMGERACLSERYDALEWRDETAIEFYENVFSQIDSQPNEFIATATKYEHGIGLHFILPSEVAPLIKSNIIHGVQIYHADLLDLSRRAPQLSHVAHGAELFISSGDSKQLNTVYRTPAIDLACVRNNTGPGTNQPEQIDLLVGNQSIEEWLSKQLEVGLIEPKTIADICMAFAFIAEAHDVRPIVVPAISDQIPAYRTHFMEQIRARQLHVESNTRVLQLLAEFAVSLTGEAIKITKLYESPAATSLSSESLRLRDRRTWPYTTPQNRSHEELQVAVVSQGLKRETKEVQDQILLSEFYLSAVRRYLSYSQITS